MPANNVVMFTIDDMRSVEDWGNFASLVVTPNIDRLMDAGTTFERAVAQVPLCNPSRSSVFTGRQPSATGIIDNDVPWYDRNDPADTLPAVLRQAGAYVAMFGKNFHDDPLSMANQRILFDDFLWPATDDTASQIIRDDVFHAAPFKSGRYGGPDNLRDARTTAAALDFLTDEAPDLSQPFYLGVGITRPHLNWVVPSAYWDLYDSGAIRAALQKSLADGSIIPAVDEYMDVPPMNRPDSVSATISADMDLWVDYIHGYLASVSYADAKIGQVVRAINADPDLRANTSIVLWSDNGFHLGDETRWQKNTPWRAATEVPLVIVEPGGVGGRSAQSVVNLVDLYPTVLDLMGIDTPKRLQLDGTSLVPLARNPNGDWFEPAAGKGVGLSLVEGIVSLRAVLPGFGDVRYSLYPDGREELYDLGRDPQEHTNRLNARGDGLTGRDDRIHRQMTAILDERMESAGIHRSEHGVRINGDAHDEMFISSTRAENDVFAGRNGDDTYILYADAQIVEQSGGGNDTVYLMSRQLERSFKIPAHVEMVKVLSTFSGNADDNWIAGTNPGGALRGAVGDDTLRAGTGNKGYVLDGGHGNDVLQGGSGPDTIRGGTGNDILEGDRGKDTLSGGPGKDFLRGGDSNDLLWGGLGADRLVGNEGRDTFLFRAAAESSPGGSDTIRGFDAPGPGRGDRIDLSDIDANLAQPGHQAFAFGGTAAGHVRVVDQGRVSLVLANLDTDRAPELRIVIEDGVATHASAYTADDFIL
jgi:arylsulfatase A-like enzyme